MNPPERDSKKYKNTASDKIRKLASPGWG